MNSVGFDRFVRAFASCGTRRATLGLTSVVGLAAISAWADVAVAKKKHKKHKKHKKKRPCEKAACCTDADCEPLFLCAQGQCVMGQGTCPTGSDGCAVGTPSCGIADESDCACMQSTVGATRCSAGKILPGYTCSECVNDSDCRSLYPDIPGVFCARGGPQCACGNPNSGWCQGPCLDHA